MLEARLGKANRDWSGSPQECLFTQGAHVSRRIIRNAVPRTNTYRPEIFDEYTRRQYLAKAPQRNPFGEDEEPARFADLDVFTKLKVLYQLSVWTLINPDRIRERMPEEKEAEQTQWVCYARGSVH